MYACICEAGAEFFMGMCALIVCTKLRHDPPPMLRATTGVLVQGLRFHEN
jgi:hypothetical protein